MAGTQLNMPNGLDNSSTAIVVDADQHIPTAPFYCTFETGETIKVTSGGGNNGQWTVARGQLSSTATAHKNGERLTVSISREHTLALLAGSLPPGVTSDGLTPGGVIVAGAVEAEKALLTGPGGPTPTLTAKKRAGQTGYLLNLTDENGVLKASVAVDGEFLTADDVLAPTGTIKGATLAFYPSGTGAPASGLHSQGEMHMDTSGALFVCTVTGTPGTWLQATLS